MLVTLGVLDELATTEKTSATECHDGGGGHVVLLWCMIARERGRHLDDERPPRVCGGIRDYFMSTSVRCWSSG
ncbi:protein of unknown function [Pseudorhizobium banfieldiae]|uniref:Uncharacterized protein n=1 Tax=Pseudorhizobium banfieldiae TaxID=1125847 RepID=L0NE56_9HYPH|nr:protein of unknown function [Pseudorhizobium banfieldiae]